MLTTFALTFVMAGLTEAAPPTVITSLPYTISSSGQYKLGADLAVGSGVTAIGITANDVHLNLNGHTISGPILTASDALAAPTTAGISVFIATNVHINNGTVKGFSHGVVLSGSISAGKGCDDNHLNDLTVTSNRRGIAVFEISDNNHINGNNVSGNFEIGVFIHTSDHNKCNGNVVNNNGGITGGGGFFIANSDGNVIANNNISGNTPSQIGVRLSDSHGHPGQHGQQ
jgi:parallel beta-helix repeat protein